MSDASPTKKRAVALGGVIVALILAALVSWASFRPRALSSVKELTVNIYHTDGTVFTRTFETTGRTLLEALEDQDFVELEENNLGISVAAADGERADPESDSFWLFTVNGAAPEDLTENQPVKDGDVFDYYLQTGE